LIDNNLLSRGDEQALLHEIPFGKNEEWLKLIYGTKINKVTNFDQQLTISLTF
jgi:hypothetical protein